MTTLIKEEDLIESVAAALQYISYYHPADFISHLATAYHREQSPAAKDAIAQILTNSKMSAMGHRPMCQDTGIVNVFLKVGMDIKFDNFKGGLEDAINEGVRRGYNYSDNMLRASVVSDPEFARKNTQDNSPAVIFTQLVPGNKLDITVAAKGGGSENKSKIGHAQPQRQCRRLGFENSPHHGCRLVPSWHAGNWHWWYCRKGRPDGQRKFNGRP